MYDVIIIGGGQSGLAVAYYLRRTKLRYLVLDDRQKPGGAWQYGWDSLRLFSPAQYSSLPGIMFPGGLSYPHRDEVISYLEGYEKKYRIPVQRPVKVQQVEKTAEGFKVNTNEQVYQSKAVVSATGSYSKPFIPDIPGRAAFGGTQLHSSSYHNPDPYRGKQVVIVGEGNSGAQIMAEVSQVADAVWATSKEPVFLPAHVDGEFLFNQATLMYEARKRGEEFKPASLGDIVQVPAVKQALQDGRLINKKGISSIDKEGMQWEDGSHTPAEAIIWCTGFKPALDHLPPEVSVNGKKVPMAGNMVRDLAGLWLVGYGNWTGFASATLIGVGRSARKAVDEIQEYVLNN